MRRARADALTRPRRTRARARNRGRIPEIGARANACSISAPRARERERKGRRPPRVRAGQLGFFTGKFEKLKTCCCSPFFPAEFFLPILFPPARAPQRRPAHRRCAAFNPFAHQHAYSRMLCCAMLVLKQMPPERGGPAMTLDTSRVVIACSSYVCYMYSCGQTF